MFSPIVLSIFFSAILVLIAAVAFPAAGMMVMLTDNCGVRDCTWTKVGLWITFIGLSGATLFGLTGLPPLKVDWHRPLWGMLGQFAAFVIGLGVISLSENAPKPRSRNESPSAIVDADADSLNGGQNSEIISLV